MSLRERISHISHVGHNLLHFLSPFFFVDFTKLAQDPEIWLIHITFFILKETEGLALDANPEASSSKRARSSGFGSSSLIYFHEYKQIQGKKQLQGYEDGGLKQIEIKSHGKVETHKDQKKEKAAEKAIGRI